MLSKRLPDQMAPSHIAMKLLQTEVSDGKAWSSRDADPQVQPAIKSMFRHQQILVS
jgi:hypothetical protein